MADAPCPTCNSVDVVVESETTARCNQCGSQFERAAVMATVITGCEADSLAAELREAFGLAGDDALPASGVWSARRSEHGVSWEERDLEAGSRLADFEVLGELGRGGMGVVYRARQISLGREVALKVLPDVSRHGRSAVVRFRHEAQAAARLNHANVVPVYAQGEQDGHYFYAMKLVRGESLDGVIRSKPHLLSSTNAARSAGPPKLSWNFRNGAPAATTPAKTKPPESIEPADETSVAPEEDEPPTDRSLADYRHIASLLAGVADGLAHAHAEGVLHRDIKPHNLILGNDQRLYITDFGLARLADQPHLTQSGEIMGTPSYLSPEQARGDVGAIDQRTDVYSLGVTLYEMITGRRPFEGETRDQIIHALCHDAPVRPRKHVPAIPRDLETICLRAMNKEPGGRYGTALELAEELRRFADGRPIRARRITAVTRAIKWVRRHKAVTVATAAVVALAVTASAAVVWTSAQEQQDIDRLVAEAYDTLVHNDYTKPGPVQSELDEAEQLGATDEDLRDVRALMDMGLGQAAAAIKELTQRLVENPSDSDAQYMRAWAWWENRAYNDAREAVAAADEAGGPQTPEAWFFRGLAMHWDDVDEAIASYATAVQDRRDAGAFFPQAELNLARAHNQHMSRTRTLEGFDEAISTLQWLISNGHYEGHPYYLLTITYQMAAEHYLVDSDVRSEAIADDYFAKAIDVAEQCHEVWPSSVRCYNAHAMCLERMGRIEDAVAQRTHAIELAGDSGASHEAYYYRWRLYYWLGRYDEAMADVKKLQSFTDKNDYYHFVYPALILAARGDTESAIGLARDIAEPYPDQTKPTLLSASLLRLFGEAAEADELLATRHDTIDWSKGLDGPETEAWFEAMYEFVAGDRSEASLEDLAKESDRPWALLADAYFHAGVMALQNQDTTAADDFFRQSYRTYRGDWGTVSVSRALLGQIEYVPDK